MLYSHISERPVQYRTEPFTGTENAVCITGHRENVIKPVPGRSESDAELTAAVKLMLYKYIDMAVEKGYTTFYDGLASGADLWAADYIIQKKKHDPRLRLIGVMPYMKHYLAHKGSFQALLREVELGADELIVTNPDPLIRYSSDRSNKEASSLYKVRNYFMVESSSAVISFFNSGTYRSGTSQTISYAVKRGRIVRYFGIEDVLELIDEAKRTGITPGAAASELENVFDLPY